MRRAYLFAALLFGAALIVVAAALLSNPISIPDAPVASLGSNGRLLLADPSGVSILDLATGQSHPVFSAEPRGLVSAAASSPDGSTLALTYAPPPDGLIQFGYTNLYSMPLGSSGPPHLLVDGKMRDVIAGPVWAADGKNILYFRSGPTPDGLLTQRDIERVAPADGVSKVVLEGSFAPDVSRDGAKLVYISAPELTSPDRLMIADADGSGAARLAGDQFLTIDRPRFSPDGQWIVFSGDEAPKVRRQPAPLIDWADLLGGVRTASAHSIPTADLWRIGVAGGSPTRLVLLQADGIAADYSPDGAHIAFITTQGLYIVDADGSHAVRIAQGNSFGSVQWLPE